MLVAPVVSATKFLLIGSRAQPGAMASSSSCSYPLELLGAHANGRFGVRRLTALSLSATGMHYTTHDTRRDDFEYVSIDPMDPLSLHVKFHSRPKAKQFFFKQREQCEVALQAIHDWGDPYTHEGLRIEGTASSYAGSSAAFASDLKELEDPQGAEGVAVAQHSAYRYDTQSPASSLSQCWQLVRPRDGRASWCCRVHAAEATIFGVLLPMAVLLATLFQISRELDAHGGAWFAPRWQASPQGRPPHTHATSKAWPPHQAAGARHSVGAPCTQRLHARRPRAERL